MVIPAQLLQLHQHPINKLNELFPKLKDGGGLNPPPQYLSSGYKLVEWRVETT
jgi:hypothetical protein